MVHGLHAEGVARAKDAEQDNRSEKECRVREGRAHAALVYDGSTCGGWCQFGPTGELPRIKHRRAYLEGLSALPAWRITCFFSDSKYRRQGVAAAALDGALHEIARLGGGTVESYPEDTGGRKVFASFLHNGTVTMFESHGFERTRRIGKTTGSSPKSFPERLPAGVPRGYCWRADCEPLRWFAAVQGAVRLGVRSVWGRRQGGCRRVVRDSSGCWPCVCVP